MQRQHRKVLPLVDNYSTLRQQAPSCVIKLICCSFHQTQRCYHSTTQPKGPLPQYNRAQGNQRQRIQPSCKRTILDTDKCMVCFTTTTIVNSFKKVGFHTHDNAELEIATPPEITATNFEEYAKSNPPCTVLPNEKISQLQYQRKKPTAEMLNQDIVTMTKFILQFDQHLQIFHHLHHW